MAISYPPITVLHCSVGGSPHPPAETCQPADNMGEQVLTYQAGFVAAPTEVLCLGRGGQVNQNAHNIHMIIGMVSQQE
jgi:hypothetical protein